MAEEEMEYDSDPEEAKLSLKMRRKEASDDEEEEAGNVEESDRKRREKPLRCGIDSDGESECEGDAAEYDDPELEVDEGEEEYYEDEEEVVLVEEEYEEGDGKICAEHDGTDGGGEGEGAAHEELEEKEVEMQGGTGESSEVHELTGQNPSEDEKKDNEPFSVPTAGAFYMHDDRLRNSTGRRYRRTFDGSKLWETKDDRRWGHDKFEEMNMKEIYFEGRRSSRGYYRGRGKARGMDQGFPRGSRPGSCDGNNHQNIAPKTVRGRGPRRYQPLKRKNEAPLREHERSVKSLDKTSPATPGTVATPTVELNPLPVKMVASNLSSASPPFYPSGSSNKENMLTQKSYARTESTNRNIQPPVTDDGLAMQQLNSFQRGRDVINSVGMDKLYIDDSFPAVTSKQLNNLHMPTAVNKVPPSAQIHAPQRNPAQSRTHPSLQASDQQLGQHPVNASQGSPPRSSLLVHEFEPGDSKFAPESSKSKTALVGKGKGVAQSAGRAPFLYSGAQVIRSGGNVGAGHDDQSFPASPAFLPVMQFGSQHPGGVGVPAVGMAFPGYVAQSKLGSGNSEMTWLPVLAGAAGALGAAYCSPYISLDGAYHAQPTWQTSALPSSSKDDNGTKPSNEWKPQHRSELLTDGFSQRQNKPRRYSEMNFGQALCDLQLVCLWALYLPNVLLL
ncbi:hypothetical protein Nepgr_017793 [Nepenthes gracilis]|uniref:Btz domain-containing protein n=1 Tax=Nepenthes gracilis TaxID=150966 RepID=A0AAD3SRT1_NEPGR|nr:hypothetical protein Nepgr_017793 [Nepenthes gracilis]